MIRKNPGSLLSLCILYAASVAGAEPPGAPDSLREEGRALTQRFAAELKSELKQALEHGGPQAAIPVCRDRAPLIAGALARETGARIGRTSLRFRNPQNAPLPWQQPVLERFDELPADADAEQLEWFETVDNQGVAARYMKAIPVQPLCLACHGNPAGAVGDALEQSYPHDRATGYQTGQIRGAFYIEWLVEPSRRNSPDEAANSAADSAVD